MYVGIDGVAKEVKKVYVSIDGVAREVKKAYVGINGVAREFWISRLYDGVSTFIFDGSNIGAVTNATSDYFTLTVIKYDLKPLYVYIDDVLVSTIEGTDSQAVTLNGETTKLLATDTKTCTVTIKTDGFYSLGHLGFFIEGTVGKATANYWTNMTDVILSNNINSILDSTFTEFKGTSITIPNSVTSIGTRAFAECTALTDITFAHKAVNSLSIAFDSTTVSNCAFYVSSNVATNVYHKGNTSVLNYGWATCLRTVTFLEA